VFPTTSCPTTLAHERVVEAVQACCAEAHVVLWPDGPELGTGLRQLLDELSGSGIVRVSSGFGAQDARGVVRHGRPVVEEVPDAFVEEHVARVVRRSALAVEYFCVQRAGSALAAS
jgi:hypothetical protein